MTTYKFDIPHKKCMANRFSEAKPVRVWAFVVSAVLLGGLQQQATAATFTFSATSGSLSSTLNWSVNGNWSGGTAPTSDADNELSFTSPNGSHMPTSNDIGTGFQLNRLTLTNNSSSTNNKQLSIASGSLNFVKNSSDVLPTLVLGRGTTNGGKIILSSAFTVTDALTITNSAKSSTQETTISGAITNNAGITFDGAGPATITLGSGTISGAGGLTLNGSYTVNMTGNNTYTGLTDVQAGTLTINRSGGTIANTAAVRVSGGTLNVAQSDTVGAVTLSSGTISGAGTLTGSSYSLTDSGTVSAILGGSGDLTKTGAGTVTFSKANTYTGQTMIGEGVLVLGIDNAIAASSDVVLAGGTLESAFSQTLGTLDLSASSTLDLSTGGSFYFDDSSALAGSWTGTLSIIGTFVDGVSVRFGTSMGALTTAQLGQISINGDMAGIDSDGYLVLATIPEASTCALILGAVALGFVFVDRRRAFDC